MGTKTMDNLSTFFPLSFSASMMEDVYKCQTYFFRSYIQCLAGGKKSPDLIAGSHIAKACEIVRTSYFTQGLLEDEAIDLGIEYILSAEDTGDDIKTNENVAHCLRQYFKKFKLAEALPPCSLADGTHAVEYKFEFDLGIPHPDLPDRNIKFAGRLDYICENVQLQRTTIHGLDEKSCKSLFRLKGSKTVDYEKEANQYRTNGQIISYCWAARELGIPLNSFFIRRIPIMSQFEEAYELEIPIDNFAIDNWYNATRQMILQLVIKYIDYKRVNEVSSISPHKVFYPTNQTTACLSYSKTCKYMEGCLTKYGEAELMERFTQRVYDRELRQEIPLEQFLEKLNGTSK